ncbi:Malto-oligosyltrehalose trehalohydrolase [Legionella birminghamensis]|uniref:Malto-oligosyltrehalose trehalohydrolase n=1 Tax=Legionella birminghamensis TaxID=28083 RepID=A0A378I821_9GAMM|nr:malto-oligosyltrehalose trehalohydrolase [Legionella birminghamensis]KTC68349.1 Malto-oligosyltrehalose trehalohydrolase [Legionella birminghamensis]STX30936.1 Malto-oligosyltrehalose trehalohydrolase [Legionella birminghamensis]
MDKISNRTLGANLNAKGRCEFKVWAPNAVKPALELINSRGETRVFPMVKMEDGYYFLALDQVEDGDCYYYLFANHHFPDPAADFLPQGINGPSAIIKKPQITTRWTNRPLRDYIIYELHVGTFTEPGTFTAVIDHLDELKDLGITAIEIMPIAQFSGERNWGYDGVYPFAVQNSYGGPQGLRALIQACHERNIAVILDVVYNHIGPEGNHFSQFGPYFTDKYQTLWGQMLNFDDQYNHHVRRYFIENALHWFIEYDIDALRLDALHAIVDTSAYPFLEQLADAVNQTSQALGKPLYLIAENDANDVKLITEKSQGGFGMHAQWNDDFHHALHSLLTRETQNYYQDFGRFAHLLKALREGFVYSGAYSSFRKRPHGRSSVDIPAERLVVCLQNHDQIGNRAQGERLSVLVNDAKLKLGAGLLLTAPFIPLLFMGEEYGEPAPFLYFISHSDPKLIEAVRQGRRREFAHEPNHLLSDPQDTKTFEASKLNHALKQQAKHQHLWKYYQQLIHLRKSFEAISSMDKDAQTIQWDEERQWLSIVKHHDSQSVLILASFSEQTHLMDTNLLSDWALILHSYDTQWTENHQENLSQSIPPFGFLLFKDNHHG